MGSPEQLGGRLQERRAVVPSLALGIYGVITAVFLTILLLSPDRGPGVGPGLRPSVWCTPSPHPGWQ